MRRTLLMALAVLLSFALGFGLARRRSRGAMLPESAPRPSHSSAIPLAELLRATRGDPGALPAGLPPKERLSLLRELVRDHAPTPEALALRRALLAGLAKDDPRTILSLARERILWPDEAEFLVQAVGGLAKADPTATANLISGLPRDWRQREAWKQLAKTMAEADPESAMALAEKAGVFTAEFKNTVLESWKRTAPMEAYRHALGQLTLWEMNHLSQAWTNDGWKNDLPGYLAALQDTKLSPHMKEFQIADIRNQALRSWSELSAETKTKLAEILPPEDLARARLLDLARTDPDAALAQAQAEEKPRRRLKATRAVIDDTLKRDPNKALAMALATPGRNLRHDVFHRHAEIQAKADPRAAWEWAKTVADPVAQAGAGNAVMGEWLKRDFPSAAKALAESPEMVENDKWLPRRVIDNLKLSAMEVAHWESLREFWRSLPATFQTELRRPLEEKLGGSLPAEFRAAPTP